VHDKPVIGAEIDCTVIAGRNLVAKDRSLFGKKSSDPFVVISCAYHGGVATRTLGTTAVVDKNLSPVWNEHFKLNIDAKAATRLDSSEIVFSVFDKDMMSADDPMGEVRVPLKSLVGGHVRPSAALEPRLASESDA
jgi:Ca2+-dependent lipid-binding protein